MPRLAMKSFSAMRSWVVARILRIGQDRHQRRQERGGLRRDVFEFVGDDINAFRKTRQRLLVVIAGTRTLAHDVEWAKSRSGAKM